MERSVQSALIIVVLLLAQTTFIPLISLGGFLPDLLMIWLVIVALQRGQIEATVTGFVAGLLQDLVATKFLGLAALSKTIACFVIGYFYNENMIEQTLGSYRFLMLVLLASFLHDLVYFLVFLQGVEGSLFFTTVELSTGMALYTGLIAVLPMFAFSRRYNTSWAQ